MGDFFQKFWSILCTLFDPRNLTNPEAFKDALNQPGVFPAAFAAVTMIVFTETGLFVGFLLPGDSLLVTVGLIARSGDWPIFMMMPVLILAAVIGDSVGYSIGKKFGPKLFTKDDSWIFKKKYLIMARDFYNRHGGKTIIIAKFVPIIRTFAPVVAGIARMPFRRYVTFSLIGATLWVPSMILLGYTLQLWLNPLLEKLFGQPVDVARHIDKVILVVITVSVLPLLIKGYKNWKHSRQRVIPQNPVTVPGPNS
jgi:membrane-associated protein